MFNWIAGFIVILIIVAFFWPQGKLTSEPNTTQAFIQQNNERPVTVNRDNSFSKANDTQRAQSFRDAEIFDQNIKALLEQANDLFEQKNYTLPKSHNALKVYQDILTLSPNNASARKGIENILDQLLLIGKNALSSNKVAAADITLAKLNSIDKESAQAILLSSDIAIWHEKKKQSDILGQADQAFNSGNYIAPATKNALYFYEKMLSIEPKNQRALNGIEKIINVYANKTKDAISANQISDATTSLEILNEIDPSYPLIPSLRNKIQQAKNSQE